VPCEPHVTDVIVEFGGGNIKPPKPH